MKIITTPRELFDKGIWMEACELLGINEWAVNEGLMCQTEGLELSHEQAIELGLIKDDSRSRH